MKAWIASMTEVLIVRGTAYALSPVSLVERFYEVLSKLDIPVSMFEFIDPDDFMKKVDAASYTLSENEFVVSVIYFWAENDIFRALSVNATLRGLLLKKIYFAKSVFTPGNLIDIYKMNIYPPVMKKNTRQNIVDERRRETFLEVVRVEVPRMEQSAGIQHGSRLGAIRVRKSVHSNGGEARYPGTGLRVDGQLAEPLQGGSPGIRRCGRRYRHEYRNR
jgi:hypothetical protein